MNESFAEAYRQMDVDEDRSNAVWLESVKDNFDQAILEENWGLARDVIQDVRDGGFEEYKDMMTNLQKAMKVESERMIYEDRME